MAIRDIRGIVQFRTLAMKNFNLDAILEAMLKVSERVSDLNFSVGRPTEKFKSETRSDTFNIASRMASRLKFFMASVRNCTMPRMSLMAIDYGGRRIGVAVSDSGVVATPHSVVKNEGDVIEKLARLARE